MCCCCIMRLFHSLCGVRPIKYPSEGSLIAAAASLTHDLEPTYEASTTQNNI